MFSLFICFNPISYLVAQAVLRQAPGIRGLVLYEARRFPRPHGAPGWHLKIGAKSHQLIHALAAMGLISSVYQPHMQVTTRRLKRALAHIRTVHYLDDGLDTLREVPRNFEVEQLVPGTKYHTFREYGALPRWMGRMDVCRVASLASLSSGPRKGQPFPAGSHVLIESPGLDVQATLDALRRRQIEPIVVPHPVKAKQGALSGVVPAPVVWHGSGNLDADIAATRGASIHIGETMSLVVARHGDAWAGNDWHLHLSPAQRHNLIFTRSLPEDETRDG